MQLVAGELLLAQTSHFLLEPGILPVQLLQHTLGLLPQLALALKLLR